MLASSNDNKRHVSSVAMPYPWPCFIGSHVTMPHPWPCLICGHTSSVAHMQQAYALAQKTNQTKISQSHHRSSQQMITSPNNKQMPCLIRGSYEAGLNASTQTREHSFRQGMCPCWTHMYMDSHVDMD
eukprot:1145730-Pelagomonas_calceolata.AAC.6